jgi:hypothetical protein
MKLSILGLIVFVLVSALVLPSRAAEIDDNRPSNSAPSGLPLPRFASLRSGNVNMRMGPGTRYPIAWVFTHQGMPVEILAEYDIWRRVRDTEGTEGWIHKTELSGKRMAIITGAPHDLLRDADYASAITAHLDAGAIGQVMSCAKEWCKMKFDGSVKGYARKTWLWGVYPNEVFE